jgi:hypothetical protein
MTSVLAIDPGPEESAWVILNGGEPAKFGKFRNEDVLRSIWIGDFSGTEMVIEQIASFGMPVGAEVFETVFWSGRFAQAWRHGAGHHRIKRHEVKMHLCGNMRAKDANIRQALIDRFGGKKETKKGGKLYGISGDVWSALAVAVTFADKIQPATQNDRGEG